MNYTKNKIQQIKAQSYTLKIESVLEQTAENHKKIQKTTKQSLGNASFKSLFLKCINALVGTNYNILQKYHFVRTLIIKLS